MIMNDRQYRITRAAAERFRGALDAPKKTRAGVHPTMATIERRAMEAQLRELDDQVHAYESLRRGRPKLAGSLYDLGGLLVQARIARGWSQLELGERVGVKMQQIQRYEKTLYESASLSRLLEVAQALGVTSEIKFKLEPLLESLATSAAVAAARS